MRLRGHTRGRQVNHNWSASAVARGRQCSRQATRCCRGYSDAKSSGLTHGKRHRSRHSRDTKVRVGERNLCNVDRYGSGVCYRHRLGRLLADCDRTKIHAGRTELKGCRGGALLRGGDYSCTTCEECGDQNQSRYLNCSAKNLNRLAQSTGLGTDGLRVTVFHWEPLRTGCLVKSRGSLHLLKLAVGTKEGQ